MELTPEEEKIKAEAVQFVKENSAELVKKFVLDKKPVKYGFVTVFMAGSPGAGKTEYANRFLPIMNSQIDKFRELFPGPISDGCECLLIRVDVDEIREWIPGYQKTDQANGTKGNAHIIQTAANRGLNLVRKYCLENDISFLHDGTFGNYDILKSIIQQCLDSGRRVVIFYIYMDPVAAWNFTKAREMVEGRNILKENFIKQYYDSKTNVEQAKKDFGERIEIACIVKNEKQEVVDSDMNVDSVDQYLKSKYSEGVIRDYSVEELEKLID